MKIQTQQNIAVPSPIPDQYVANLVHGISYNNVSCVFNPLISHDINSNTVCGLIMYIIYDRMLTAKIITSKGQPTKKAVSINHINSQINDKCYNSCNAWKIKS